MERRQFLRSIAATAAGSTIWLYRPGTPDKIEKPNIVYIMADDLGYAVLGCYGQKKIKTPNIDQLAKEGVRFTQVYAGSTVCAPSRSVLMTGQHTGHTRIRGNMCKVGGVVGYKGELMVRRMNLLEEDITVAQVLRQAGYRTGLMGKWHIGGFNPEAGPLDRGFDEFMGGLTLSGDQHGPAYWPFRWYKNRELIDIPENQNGKRGYYRPDIDTDNAIEFLKTNKDRPFYLFLSFSVPHSPFDAPDYGPYKDENWPHEEKTFAAMVDRLDRCVGRFMEALKDLNLDEKTLVIFTSDNGPRSEGSDVQTRVSDFFDSNGPLQGYKRDLYEGGIRVPMIVRWSGKVPAGKTSDAVWYFADFLPTAAALARVQPPENIDGINVLPFILDPSRKTPDRFLYWEFFEGGFQQAVRWKNWKAIRLKKEESLLLFDITKDSGEVNDVAGNNPDVVARIEEYLKTARTESHEWPVG